MSRDHPAATRHRLLAAGYGSLALLSLLVGTLSSGCRLLPATVEVPVQTVRAITPGKDKHTLDPVEVQQTLLRFADEYSTQMALDAGQLQRGTNAPDPAQILNWKIAIATETCFIVSGANAIANLLDMTVFVTVTRLAVEEHWQPNVFGESAQPLLESCRNAEAKIWQLAGKVLKPEQQTELRQAITEWHRRNPLPESVLAVRPVGFAAQGAQASQAATRKLGSVFNLLKVDPFAGMDPAVREIAQARMLAERALFVTQKMPMLLRWQTELLSVNAVALPAVRQLVVNSTQIAASVERFAAVAEKLPGQVSAEREEILKALQSQEKQLTPLVNEVRQTLTAGSQMATSLNTTLTTFDAAMERLGVGDTNHTSPPKTNAEPFRIRDYTATAAQLEATARQLTELLVTLDQTIGSTNFPQLSAQVGPVVQQAQAGGKAIVDYAFGQGILLVVVALAAALIYRWLTARLMSTARSKPNSP